MVAKRTPTLLVLALSSRALAAVPAWGQCGGSGWTGETVCVSGYTCTFSNDFYSQCLPGTAATTSAAATTTRTTTAVVSSATTTRTTTLITTTAAVTTTTLRPSSTTTAAPAPSNVIFVSPSGSDSGTGSITSPLKSIQSAVNLATPGYTIYLRAGTYALAVNVNFAKSGTASLPYVVRAYQGEKVILDGEALTGTPAAVGGSLANADRGIFHIQNANYWKFYDLEFINGPYGVYNRDASNNHFERLITRNNYETGFQIEGASANNKVYYLDSYGNRDPRKNGESADGIGVKSGSGTGNLFKGARVWNNVDDGIDLWEFASPVTLEDCIVWGNGYNRWGFPDFQGDGNGFKLGGGATGAIPSANHIVRNSISFLNAVDGIIDNGNAGSLTISRSTSFNNGRHGYRFQSSSSTFTSNIAASNIGNPTAFTGSHSQSGNSWNIGGTWNNATFKSVSASLILGARSADGKIVGSGFLEPVSGAAIGASTYWT